MNCSSWKSVLAGITVVVITTPFNIIVSKNYAAAQDTLMKIRDRKMAVVSEALQGQYKIPIRSCCDIHLLNSLFYRYPTDQVFCFGKAMGRSNSGCPK